MSFHPDQDREYRGSGRPTLPPIRDLFRDELSRSPRVHRAPSESPSSSFAQLSVDDDGPRSSYPRHYNSPHSSQVYGQLTGPGYGPPHSREGRFAPLSNPNEHFQDVSALSSSRPSSSHISSRMPANPPHRPSRESHHSPPGRPASYDTFQSPAPSLAYPSPYRNSVPPAGHRYDPRVTHRPSEPSLAPRFYPPAPTDSHLHGYPPPGPQYPSRPPTTISTSYRARQEEDEHTPIARHRDTGPDVPGAFNRDQPSTSAGTFGHSGPTTVPAKYECTYCGKGFTRPSSLKIHLNSHTGEKPFLCPVESCGRSFSVLSNMRRHARVHVPNTFDQQLDLSSDDGVEEHPSSGSASASAAFSQTSALYGQPHGHRGSSPSASSSSSRRSRSPPNDSNPSPEKRSRRHQK